MSLPEKVVVKLVDRAPDEFILYDGILAGELLAHVCSKVGIQGERKYFGLKYKDSDGITQWLCDKKKLVDHEGLVLLDKKEPQLTLFIKFMIPNPAERVRRDITKHHFFIISKRQLTANTITATDDEIYYAFGLTMQRNYLDYNDNHHKPEVRLLLMKWLPDDLMRDMGTDFCISRVHKRWAQHEAVSRRSALDMYLTFVAGFSDYGVHWFDAKDEVDKSKLRVGVCTKGVRILRGDSRQPRHWFPMGRIKTVIFKDSKFGWEVNLVELQKITVLLHTSRECAALFQVMQETHTFFVSDRHIKRDSTCLPGRYTSFACLNLEDRINDWKDPPPLYYQEAARDVPAAVTTPPEERHTPSPSAGVAGAALNTGRQQMPLPPPPSQGPANNGLSPVPLSGSSGRSNARSMAERELPKPPTLRTSNTLLRHPQPLPQRQRHEDVATQAQAQAQDLITPPAIFENYNAQIEEIVQMPFFHGRMSRKSANAMLTPTLPGQYIFRESMTEAGQNVLSFRTTHAVKHYLIFITLRGRFNVSAKQADSFGSIVSMLAYYLHNPIYTEDDDVVYLKYPLNR